MSGSTVPTRATPTRGPAKPLPYVVAGILLAAAIVLPLVPQLYSFDKPRLGGMPFFYWYQLVWVPISAALSGSAYWLVTKEDRRRREVVRGGSPGVGGSYDTSADGSTAAGKHAASSDDRTDEGGEKR
ncbi:hypothetical protein GCM10027449_06210 [Sinomonas notoginsengisoli]|uniref:DUF3311 domain-containing protein n=1 Tax=Sinomonas notoginsengisoli TaxID=1457311 RepID=UPI001F18B058|nr:DUF3311 domain-containing protein [Sinomonas notoginsengisoli]